MAEKKKTQTKKAAVGKVAAATKAAPAKKKQDNIDAIGDVRLTMTAELGRTRETIGRIMELGDQSLIELDKSVGEPVEILLNGKLFARGEVVTVSENFGVRVIEVVSRPGD